MFFTFISIVYICKWFRLSSSIWGATHSPYKVTRDGKGLKWTWNGRFSTQIFLSHKKGWLHRQTSNCQIICGQAGVFIQKNIKNLIVCLQGILVKSGDIIYVCTSLSFPASPSQTDSLLVIWHSLTALPTLPRGPLMPRSPLLPWN